MLTNFRMRAALKFVAIGLIATLTGCGGGGSTSTSTTPPPVVPVANEINISASMLSIPADNSASTTITATVTNAANAAVSGVPITFSADTGFLSASAATSDATGMATVTFSSGTSNASTRTATITATASGRSTQIPISISGTTATVSSTASTIVVGGSTATLTVLVKTGAGAALPGQTVSLTSAGTGSVLLTPASGTTDANGNFTSVVSGTAVGTSTVTIGVAGQTRTFVYTVSAAAAAFQITSPATDPSAASINTPTAVIVSAPSPTTSVTFVSTLGTWDATGTGTVTKAVSGGTVSANLVSSQSGTANVQVYDTSVPTTSSTRSISFTAASNTANRITLQATPQVVATNSSGTSGLSTLVATVFNGTNPVGGAAVSFSIANPTGGGETILPAAGVTSSIATSSLGLGQVKATFSSGSLPSGAGGVQVIATVTGTSTTATTSIVIGGTAGSVTIGRATAGASDSSNTLYILPMSVLVADSNGNPVTNTVISLSLWPIAFNANGTSCSPNPANDYFNEDDAFPGTSNYENLSLDVGEDGKRLSYPSRAVAGGSPTLDGRLTPPNSAAGTIPATVTTNSSGVATFSLTYTKSNALWIWDRIRATTLVQGTETVGQIEFRLPAILTDIGPPCLIPDSPYVF